MNDCYTACLERSGWYRRAGPAGPQVDSLRIACAWSERVTHKPLSCETEIEVLLA